MLFERDGFRGMGLLGMVAERELLTTMQLVFESCKKKGE